ncbi:hypothetical protein Pfo_029719 [Paulownia fortunei]|nr:hypothetical protein Pfo_029719 [Paulownia fortunei]
MSPPVTTPLPAFEIPKPDCPSTRNLKFSVSFNFSAGSTDAAGFNYSKTGPEKSILSSRSRPRLMKIRRKQMVASQDGKSLDGKMGNVFWGKDGNSGSNGSAKSGDLNGNTEQLGCGLEFGVSLNDSLFGLGLGNGKSLGSSNLDVKKETGSFVFASNKGSSNLDVQKETGSFVFGARKAGSTTNQNLPGEGSVFGPNKRDCQWIKFGKGAVFHEFQGSDNIEFVFGSDKHDSASRVKLDQQDSNKSCLHSSVDEFGKVNSAKFVFGASKNVSSVINSDPQKQDCVKNMDKSESNKDAGNTVPDVRGKVKLDTSGDSEKVCNPCFQFPFNWSDSSSKNHVNFVFGSNNSDSKVGIDLENKPTGQNGKMSNSTDRGKENAEIGIQIEGKVGFNSGGSTKPVNEMNQLNRGKAENCNGFGQHNHSTCSDINSKFRNGSSSGGSFEKGPTFSISNEMKRLNIGASEVDDNKTENFTCNFSVDTNNVFVFGSDQKILKQSAGVDSLDADYSTPNMTFAFSNYNLFTGVDQKLDNANSKSLGGKRSKKRNGKLRQRSVVQQLFAQDHVSKEVSSQQNHKSPGCGSPMDFSPYQDTSASNAAEADVGTGIKGEFAVKERDISEHCEKPHDDESNSNFSPSLPAQDGLSAVRRQYKKKYKLKVENAKQDTIGTATHEVCEHWRIRGNQAYHAGKLSKAEEFYSMGINSVPHVSTLGYSMKPLLLCYSNPIGDCTKAAELDPNFLKVTLRAGNCYLVLGEVEDAIQCYTKCLSLGTEVCLDRRITIEAADGLQKAKRVAEYMHQSAKLLQEGTDNAASSALGNIAEALSISRYSGGDSLCEQTLDIAKKNFGADHLDDPSCKNSHVKLWRWHLQTKSHYRLGRLDLALDLIEKQEKMPISSRSGDVTQESSIVLAATIRELLCLKRSGNEAFNSGRYTEAIEDYTAAISKSFESRPFMAICFCNRAAAYQSVSQIVDAIADCSLAIALDENYQKAISRRATLHEMIRDYKQAAYDLQRLISLLESQSQTKTQQYDSQSRSSGGSVRDLRRARRRLSLVEEKAKKEIPLDLYLILGIKASDAESEIKKAYRKAALRHHPDKAGQVLVRSDVGDDGTLWKDFGEKIHKDADRLFKIIGEAYAVLSDPSKRSKYDNDEEMRNIYRDSDRNSNSGRPSTSYSSPYERGSFAGRQAGSSTSFERNNSRRYWYDSRSYSNSHSRW